MKYILNASNIINLLAVIMDMSSPYGYSRGDGHVIDTMAIYNAILWIEKKRIRRNVHL